MDQFGRVLIGTAIILGVISAIRSIKYYKKTGKLNNHPRVFWQMKSNMERVIDVTMIMLLLVGAICIYI